MARKRTLTLTAEAKRALEEQRDHHPKPYVRERCAAIMKIAEGKSPHWVAKHALLKPRDPDTVYSWLSMYEAAGLPGLLARQQGGDRKSRRGL